MPAWPSSRRPCGPTAATWVDFAAWCREQAIDPAVLPVHPVPVAAYLASLAGKLGRSALNGRLAAIAYEHRRRGLAWTAGHLANRETLQLVGRRHGKPVRPAAAPTSVEIKRLLATCPDDPAVGGGMAGPAGRADLAGSQAPASWQDAGSDTGATPCTTAVSDTCVVLSR